MRTNVHAFRAVVAPSSRTMAELVAAPSTEPPKPSNKRKPDGHEAEAAEEKNDGLKRSKTADFQWTLGLYVPDKLAHDVDNKLLKDWEKTVHAVFEDSTQKINAITGKLLVALPHVKMHAPLERFTWVKMRLDSSGK